jgi:hypothetical protein
MGTLYLKKIFEENGSRTCIRLKGLKRRSKGKPCMHGPYIYVPSENDFCDEVAARPRFKKDSTKCSYLTKLIP